MTNNQEQPDTPIDSGSQGDPESVDLSERQYGIYQCNDCSNVALTLRDCNEGMTCHGEPMEEVTEVGMDVQPPDIRQVLLDAFGLPKPGLDICLCVIGEGPVSPTEVADKLDYDESTIRRYLNQLVDIGLLQKSQLNREEGGFVNVYHSIDLDEMRRESLIGFYAWAGEAARLIEDANLTKEDYRDEDHSEGLTEVFWEHFDD
jgi:predicted transcriptional regulator